MRGCVAAKGAERNLLTWDGPRRMDANRKAVEVWLRAMSTMNNETIHKAKINRLKNAVEESRNGKKNILSTEKYGERRKEKGKMN